VGKLYFAFPRPVNRVIHNGIASYAHFHDANKNAPTYGKTSFVQVLYSLDEIQYICWRIKAVQQSIE